MLVWSGSAWVQVSSMLTKAPRGVMGYAKKSTDTTTVTTTQSDLTGMTVTFVADSTRIYKTTFWSHFSMTTTGYTVALITDGSNNQLAGVTQSANGGAYYHDLAVTHIDTGISGTVTRKIRAQTNVGTATIFGGGGYPHIIVVEDIGAA
jgi:hypothetical protein